MLLKKCFTVLLGLSLLLQCFAYYGIVALYQLRKDYITRNLCENRNRPEMKCCGKCYLRKQLKKADSSNTDATLKTDKWEVMVYILPQDQLCPVATARSYDRPYNPTHPFMKDDVRLSDIFHPPAMHIS